MASAQLPQPPVCVC